MNNSYWVLYASHDKPQFYRDAGGGQREQRNASLKYVTSHRTALDIGSNIGQWTRPLAKVFDQVIGAFVMSKDVNLEYYISHFHVQD